MEIILLLLMLFASMVVHEYAHGWVAYRLGDPTAKERGRLTLNPFSHIDPFGTIILPGILMWLNHIGIHVFVFGWAKPVPVNFLRLKNPKRDILWVGLAGPAANIIFAAALLVVRKFSPSALFYDGLGMFVIVNLVFAVFNLIPIPPLDGSRIMLSLLPEKLAIKYSQLERHGFLIIIVLLYLGLFDSVVWPFVVILARFLGVHLS